MLGAQISEGKGKRTARRVVSVSPNLIVEVSFEDTSKLLGVDGINIGTYTSSPRADGTLQGEGHGVFASANGDMVTWKGMGTGKMDQSGAVSYAGMLMFNTSSPSLAALNGVAGAFEFTVSADGATHTKMWEWKTGAAAAAA
jgi:hypothetical protein